MTTDSLVSVGFFIEIIRDHVPEDKKEEALTHLAILLKEASG